jgi:DNA replication protein DnaC
MIRETKGVNEISLSNAIKKEYVRRVLESKNELLYPQKFDEVCEGLSRWLLCDDRYKNLIIYGGVGIGKTTLLESLASVLARTQAFGFLGLFSANRIASDKFIQSDGWRLLNDQLLVLIDDIGSETTELKSYGTNLTPIKTVIEERYYKKLPLIATTNLTLDKIRELYGDRVMDRIQEYDLLTYDIKESLRTQ